MLGKIFRIAGIVFVVGILGYGIYSATRPVPISDKVWDERTTLGSMEAKNYYVVYTDMVCPYCVAFEHTVVDNEEEFKQFLADNDILYEVKVTEFLYEAGQNNPINSRYSAEALYCAKNLGKFWDYYNKATKTIWDNFFAIYGYNAYSIVNQLDKNYWINLGADLGLGEDFAKCVNNNESLDEVIENTQKALATMDKEGQNGMPYMKFNRHKPNGFSMAGTWQDAKRQLELGLKSR